MPKQSLTLRAQGLNTATSDVARPNSGQLRRADNIEVNREGLWQPRRGLAIEAAFSLGSVGLDYIDTYKDNVLIHATDGQMRLIAPAGTTATPGTVLPQPNPSESPLPYGHFRTLEANNNLYLCGRDGMKRLESLTGTVAAAGVPSGLDGQAFVDQSSPGSAIGAQARTAYRMLFGKRDANQNLILGAPSGRFEALNTGALGDASRNVLAMSTIPAGVQDGTFFFQVYRSPSSVDVSTAPSDELALVYEAPVPLPVAADTIARTTNVVTIHTTTAHELIAGETVYVPRAYTGSAILDEIGDSQVGATSSNGTTWTQHNLPTGNYRAVCSNSTTIVAVGLGVCATSTDGATWNARTIPTGNYYAIAWNGSLFVAVGGSCCATSPDGITWTLRTIPANFWLGIAWSGSLFVAVSNDPACATSPDGIAWTSRTIPTGDYRSIAWSGSLFAAVGASCATSPDGITWTSRAFAGGCYAVASNGSLFVAVGTNRCLTSSDGITWTSRAIPTGSYYAAAWSGSLFVAIGTVCATSSDGIAWTSRTQGTGIFYGLGLGPAPSVPSGYYVVTTTPTTQSFTFTYNGSDFTAASLAQAITPVTVGVLDTVPDALVGAALYTNQSQDGIAGANNPPPDCLDVAKFRNTVFYAAPLRPPTLAVTLLSTVASLGVTTGDVITLPAGTITAGASEVIATGQFQVFTAGDPGSNIANTVASICRVINRLRNRGVTAVSTSDGSSIPGSFSLVSTSTLTPVSFSVSAHASAWSPGQVTTVQPKRNLNVLAFSKLDQPEAVPVLNTYRVGSADQQIYRAIPLRDANFILKADGIWRLTGSSSADFSIQPLDLTVKLVAPETAVALSNSIIALTNQGVVQITDSGVTVLSLDVEDQIQPLLAPGMIATTQSIAFALAYESERRYLLWLPTASTDTAPTKCLTYHLFRQAWTDRTDMYDYGCVSRVDNRLWMVKSTGSAQKVWRERKSLDYTDFADDLIGSTFEILAVNGTTLTLASVFGLSVGDALSQGSSWANILSIVGSIVTVDRVQAWVVFHAGVTNADAGPTDTGLLFSVDPGFVVGDILYVGSGSTQETVVVTSLEWTSGPGSDRIIDFADPGLLYEHLTGTVVQTAELSAYRGIPYLWEWVPCIGDNPGLTHHWREATILWHAGGFAKLIASFTTDRDDTSQTVEVFASDIDLDVANEAQSRVIRIGIPKEMQRGNQLHMAVSLTNGWWDWAVQGLSVIFEGVSERVSRAK